MATPIDAATANRALYLVWLRTNFPDLYAKAMQPQAGLSGILDTIGSTFNNVVKNVTEALPNLANTYTTYRTQQQLIEANSRRAELGQPPLVLQNGQLVPMTGGVYSSEDYELASSAGFSTTSIVMIAVAVGLAILLFATGRK